MIVAIGILIVINGLSIYLWVMDSRQQMTINQLQRQRMNLQSERIDDLVKRVRKLELIG